MRERELDLIAALVEGRLEDETEARALIDSSSKHREEYEAQKLAFETLSSVGSARLTDHEKAALHRDVWTELQARPTAAAKKAPWYMRWSYAAAGVLVVAGVAGIITQGGDDASVETFREVSSGLESAQVDEGGDSAGDSATDVTESAGDDAGAGAVADGSADELIPPAATFFSNKADETRERELDSAESEDLTAQHAECISRAGLQDYETIGELQIDGGPADLSGIYLVAKPAGVEVDETTPIAFVEITSCEIAHLDE